MREIAKEEILKLEMMDQIMVERGDGVLFEGEVMARPGETTDDTILIVFNPKDSALDMMLEYPFDKIYTLKI